MIAALSKLKTQSNGSLRIYTISNISKPDYIVLSTKRADWSVLARVFVSGGAGMRKPNLNFYHHVLKETQIILKDAIFVDDKIETYSQRSPLISRVLFLTILLITFA